jgi:tripartite ATP-independent transporter DctM subunit
MTGSALVLLSMGLLLAAICLVRMPVGLLLAFLGFSGYAVLDGAGNALTMLGNEFWGVFSSNGLTVIPLFVFMGQVCFRSGLSGRMYTAVASWAGHRRGGIAVATLLACGGFAAVCGSNTATAATMSAVALPEMKKYGYRPVFATGVVASGTTLGVVIPPSVVAIVLAMQEPSLSVQRMFLGGIVPGLLLLGFFICTVLCLIRLRPDWAPAGERADRRHRLAALPGLAEAVILFALVVGGLACGLFTPTEAGAAGSLLAILIGCARGLKARGLWQAVLDTMQVSAMIFILLAGAGAYGKFLTVSRTPFLVAEWIGTLGAGPDLILLLIFAVFLAGGMVMDALALLLITLPIYFPVIRDLGVDILWFSLMLLVVTTMGAITPPVGANVFVVAGMAAAPLGDVFRGAVCFLPAFFLCLLIMILLPDLVLFLPSLAGP